MMYAEAFKWVLEDHPSVGCECTTLSLSLSLFNGTQTLFGSRSLRAMPREDKQRQQQGTAPYARPHACVCCPAAFGWASHLRTHVRTVHEKRRDYLCPHCTAAFGQATNLKVHIRMLHPDQ